MKRRKFIVTALLALASLPFVYYFKIRRIPENSLSTPYMLSLICNQSVLLEIGKSYRSMVPEENQYKKLSELILTDMSGQKLQTSNATKIDKWINNKIKEDFISSQILIIKGWMISKTEARQCAIFSSTSISN